MLDPAHKPLVAEIPEVKADYAKQAFKATLVVIRTRCLVSLEARAASLKALSQPSSHRYYTICYYQGQRGWRNMDRVEDS
jgi:hypothetical protein